MQEKACCFTGHRPSALPFGSDESHIDCLALKGKLRDAIELSIQEGYTLFYSGMAEGFDTFAAEAVLEFKERYPDIRLCAVLPCADQAKSWSKQAVRRYHAILEAADEAVTLSPQYTPFCMQQRNIYMVERSTKCIAYCTKLRGGTYNTLKYALGKNIMIVTL